MKKNKQTYSKTNNIVYYSAVGATLLGVCLGAGLPWLKCIDNTPNSLSVEDKGEKVDHIFEYEEGLIDGNSANISKYWDHFCENKSLCISPLFSGGVCVRNLSQLAKDETKGFEDNNPTNTFIFTSDHTYSKLSLEVCIASKYSGGKYISTSLNAAFNNITMNGKRLNYSSVIIPSTVSPINAGNYYNMHVVTINGVKIQEGLNSLVFSHANGFLNVDYINLKTSAKITYIPTINLDPNTVTISTEPTNKATGVSTIKCEEELCTEADTYTLPALSDKNGYKMQPVSEQACTYSFNVGERVFTFNGVIPKARKVGEEHNELKKGKAASTLPNDRDIFSAERWTKDDKDTQTVWTKEDIIDKDGNLVFENTEELDTSGRFDLLYLAKNSTPEFMHYFHGGDKLALLATPIYQLQTSYVFTINASGAFRLTLGGVAGAALDLSVSNKFIIAFDFNDNKTVDIRTNDSNASYKSPTDPSTGTPEISSTATNLEFNKEQKIEFKLTRYDAYHNVIRLFVNDVEVPFTSSIADATRSANVYTKEGRFVFANRFKTTASGGQRLGVKPTLNNWVVISDLTYSQTTDTWDPTK